MMILHGFMFFMFFVHDDKRNKMMIDDTGRTPSVDPF